MSKAPSPAGIYTRVSVLKARDNNPLPSTVSHAERCRSFIASRPDLELFDVYEDADESAGTLARPALRRLLRDVEAGRVRAVIVLRLDRLTRSVRDFLHLLELFEQNSTSLIAVEQMLDTSTSTGRLFVNILISMAQWEREITSERTLQKMHDRARRGLWNGGIIPYGYRRKDKDLEPDPVEAENVRTMFSTFLRTCSIAATRDHLRSLGVLNRSGQPFTKMSIDTILRNPVYRGVVRFEEHQYASKHQALIDDDSFRAAMESRGARRVSQGIGERVYTLKGILWCAHCQSALIPVPTHKGGKVYPYYRCKAHARTGVRCPLRSIPAAAVEAEVVEALMTWAADPAALERLTKAAADDGKRGEIERARAIAQKAIADTARARSRLTDLLLKDWADPAAMEREVTAKLQEIDTRAASLGADLERLDAALVSYRAADLDAATVRASIAALRPLVPRRTPADLAALLRLLVRRIEIGPEGTFVHLYADASIKSSSGRTEWLPATSGGRTFALPLILSGFRALR